MIPPPRLGASPLSGGDQAELVDALSSVITDVCSSVLPRLAHPAGYLALSVYINETMLDKRVPAVRKQAVEASWARWRSARS